MDTPLSLVGVESPSTATVVCINQAVTFKLDEALTDIMTDRQVRVLITKMESLGLLQREGEKRGVRYLQTERFARMF